MTGKSGGGIVQTLEMKPPGGNEMHVRFMPGKDTDDNFKDLQVAVENFFKNKKEGDLNASLRSITRKLSSSSVAETLHWFWH
jgi:hypothetical protein